MTGRLRRCTFVLLVCLTASLHTLVNSQSPVKDDTPFCGASDRRPGEPCDFEPQDTLNVGEPRTVRLIYFIPNDRPFRADVVQRMKDEIRAIQTFYGDQMEAHGHGNGTFHVETDRLDEPVVHIVNGQHPDNRYVGPRQNAESVVTEIGTAFSLNRNVYLIVVDNSTHRLSGDIEGIGYRYSKNGGSALVTDEFHWAKAAHELGHAFGLEHNFYDGRYIMSYGPGYDRLSACSATFLSGHPCLNPDVPIEQGLQPTVRLVSPRGYLTGSQSISLELKLGDVGGLLQTLLFVETVEPHSAAGQREVKAWREFQGERDALVRFDYDGVVPSNGLTSLSNPVNHTITVQVLDTDGDWHFEHSILSELPPSYIDTLIGHTGRVNSVSFSPDRSLVASASNDGTVKLWNVDSRENIATLEHDAHSVRTMTFSPDGRMLVSGSRDGMVRLWDVVTYSTIGALRHDQVTSVSYSIDGGVLATGSWDGTIKLWDATTHSTVGVLQHDQILSVAYSPEGGTLASASRDGTIRLWDVTSDSAFRTLRHNRVTSLSYSPDGSTLASASRDGTIKLWDVKSNSTVRTLRHGRVTSLSYSPDGRTLASVGSVTVKLWNVLTGGNLATLRHTDRMSSVAISLDGTPLASGMETGMIGLWDTTEWIKWAAEIDIPDPNLRLAIADALGVSPIATIRGIDMAALTKLSARKTSISNLTGLESATNLTRLIVPQNSIEDLSPLSGLTRLSWLDLGANSVSDISPLASLVNLKLLFLGRNRISDVSPLKGLTDLTFVVLNYNGVSDISPLAENSGFGRKDAVQVKNNPLSYRSIYTDVPTLRERGVLVDYSKRPSRSEDVNRDGAVDILDLVLVASDFGDENRDSLSDVNGDGIVNVLDLLLVAAAFDDAPAAPPPLREASRALTVGNVRNWLTAARSIEDKDVIARRAIGLFERLLESLTPRETALLANYPNPFNPDTWIPYQLAEDAKITLTIYDSKGGVVRRLETGHKRAGRYTDQGNAEYWDGRNDSGEPVTSGTYFYELGTTSFRDLRRMVVVK